MSNFYNYTFISPQEIYALVKEELKSYFNTGAVDDLLFPKWTDKCLKKLGRSMYKIKSAIIKIEDFEGKLPPEFYAVREAWTCTRLIQTRKLPGSLYQQVSTNITPYYTSFNSNVDNRCDPCDPCLPNEVKVTYKTNNSEEVETVKIMTLLKPGNISVKQNCSVSCLNHYSNSHETFDIRDNKMIVNFRDADVYMLYYSEEYDNDGYQMIPDNTEVQEYIENYIKFKIFEMLSNQITDETFNQIERKKLEYKQAADESKVMADIETKKQTIYQKFKAIKRDMNRLSMYNIK
jgi:hypothetical protein